MDALRMGVDTLTVSDPHFEATSKEANVRRAISLVGRFPTIVAAYWRLRHGDEPTEPSKRLGPAANYLFLLVPQALRQNETMSPRNEFATVDRRLSKFFKPSNYTNVLGLCLFGY